MVSREFLVRCVRSSGRSAYSRSRIGKKCWFDPLLLLAFVAALAASTDLLLADDWAPLWSTDPVGLSEARAFVEGTAVNGKLYFAGGNTGPGSNSNAVDIYDTASGSWSKSALPDSPARMNIAVASAGGLVFFAGGLGSDGRASSAVDIYNIATSSWLPQQSLPQGPRDAPAAASAGNKVFFGGGYNNGYSSAVDIYDTSTGSWSATTLSSSRQTCAASAGGEVLFAGGYDLTASDVVDVYNTATSSWLPSNSLSIKRGNIAATSVGTKVFLAGGNYGNTVYGNVDVYDTSTNTLYPADPLSQTRQGAAAGSVGTKVAIAGGHRPSGYSNVVDIYDAYTLSHTTATISVPRAYMAAASWGNKVYFAGGLTDGSSPCSTVDVYTLQQYDTIASVQNFALQDNTTVNGLMQINAPGSLSLTSSLGSFNLAVGSINGTQPINLSGGTLTVGSDNTSATYSGALSGGGGLAKVGSGNLTLFSPSSCGRMSVAGGTLTIPGGAQLTTSNWASIAPSAGDSGTVAVSGSSSQWNVNSQLNVGDGGTGALLITARGVVTSTNLVSIGYQAGAQGSATVDGAGSAWNIINNNDLHVGYLGSGTLAVRNGATVSNCYGAVGGYDTGVVTVDGSGSRWNNNGGLWLGYNSGGTGVVSITNGGRETDPGANLGLYDGSSGSMTVNGAASTWNTNSVILGGGAGIGAVSVSSGGQVSSGDVYLGYNNSSARGCVTISGGGATWTSSGSVYCGGNSGAAGGTGTLTVAPGGKMTAAGTIKLWPGGTLNVMGGTVNTAALDNSAGGTINWTAGTLNLTNAGVTLDPGANPFGSALSIGASQALNTNGKFVIGLQPGGSGTLNIVAGGAVSCTGATVGAGYYGSASLDGAGAIWNCGGLVVADGTSNSSGTANSACSGSVSLSRGAALAATSLTIGQGYLYAFINPYGNTVYALWRGDGSVSVSGQGTSLTVAQNCAVGTSYSGWNVGYGTLNVNSGGLVSIGGSMTINNGSNVLINGGTLNVNGSLADNFGNVCLNGGTIRIGALSSTNQPLAFNYGTIDFSGSLSVAIGDTLSNILGTGRPITQGKVLQVDGTTILNDVLTINGGTFSTASLINPGLLWYNSGTFNLTRDNLLIGTSGLLGATLTLPTTKTVGVTNSATIDVTGSLNMQGGSFSAASLTNSGTIGGTGPINAPLTNATSGKVRAFNGDHPTFTATGNTNSGQILLYGGAVEFDGTLTNNPGGMIMGNGNLFTNGLTNLGTMAFSAITTIDGTVQNSGAGLITTAGGTTTFLRDVVNNAQIRTTTGSFSVFEGVVSGGGLFTGSGTVVIENVLQFGPIAATSSFGGTLAMANAGIDVLGAAHTIATPVVLEGNLAVSATDGSLLQLSDSIGESLPGSTLTLSGGGELILSGSNSYTGGTVVENGTLVLSGPSAIADGTSLSVGADATSVFSSTSVAAGIGTPMAVPEPISIVLLGGVASLLSSYTFCRRTKRITTVANRTNSGR